MQKEVVETVARDCKHFDCMYRSSISGGQTPICYYSVMTGECRRCKISECDKYKPGRAIKPKMKEEYWIEWIYGYGEDVDSIRSRFERTEL